MNSLTRMRVVSAGIGLAILPAWDGCIFLIDHLHLPAWPAFFVVALCPPILLVNFLAADAGEYAYLYTMLTVAGLLNALLYAAIGPSFWNLAKSIRESAFSK